MKDKLKTWVLKYVLRFAAWLGYKDKRMLFYCETSKVLKGEMAPEGKVFYIMRATNDNMRYTTSIMLPAKGMDANKRNMVYERLMVKLVKEYNL